MLCITKMTVYFSKGANIFVDPSSIDSQVELLATELKRVTLTSMKSVDAADEALYASYKAMLAVAYLSKEHKAQHEKLKIIELENSEMKKEIERLNGEVASMKEKVDRTKAELNGENEKVHQLTERLKSLANQCVLKARGRTLMEFKYGKYVDWDVEVELEQFKIRLPQDYEEALSNILKEPSAAKVEKSTGNEEVNHSDDTAI